MAHADADVRYEAGEEYAARLRTPSVGLVARGAVGGHGGQRRTPTPLSRFLTQRARWNTSRARRRTCRPAFSNSSGSRREVRYFAALRQDRLDREVARRQAREEAQRQLEDEVRRRAEAEERRRVGHRAAAGRGRGMASRAGGGRAGARSRRRRSASSKSASASRKPAGGPKRRRQAEEERRARQLGETDIESILELQGRVGDFVLPTPSASRAPIFRPRDPVRAGAVGRELRALSGAKVFENEEPDGR